MFLRTSVLKHLNPPVKSFIFIPKSYQEAVEVEKIAETEFILGTEKENIFKVNYSSEKYYETKVENYPKLVNRRLLLLISIKERRERDKYAHSQTCFPFK